jgi:hypothetical protein
MMLAAIALGTPLAGHQATREDSLNDHQVKRA